MQSPFKPVTEPLIHIKEYEGVLYKTYYWQPTVEIKGRVLFIHGFRDDVACYWKLIDKMTNDGYGFFYYDQVGEGETKMSDGSIGINSTPMALKSLDYFVNYQINEMKFNLEPLNLHLMSHSNGGGIMLTYLTNNSFESMHHQIKSYSSIGPLIELCSPVPSWVTNWVGGGFAYTHYGSSYPVSTPMTADQCTADQQVIEYLNGSCDLTTLVGAFGEVRDGILRGRALQFPKPNITNSTPILICHGESDEITSPTASYQFVKTLAGLGNNNAKFIKYPNGRHSLHMDVEPIRTNVCEDLLSFVNTFTR